MIFQTLLAQRQILLGSIGGTDGFGPWGDLFKYNDIPPAASIFVQILSNLLGIMTIVAGLWFLINLITGAYGFLSAGGNQENMTKASQRIGNSLIGLVVVIAAYALTSLLGTLLHFDILNPQTLIPLLKP